VNNRGPQYRYRWRRHSGRTAWNVGHPGSHSPPWKNSEIGISAFEYRSVELRCRHRRITDADWRPASTEPSLKKVHIARKLWLCPTMLARCVVDEAPIAIIGPPLQGDVLQVDRYQTASSELRSFTPLFVIGFAFCLAVHATSLGPQRPPGASRSKNSRIACAIPCCNLRNPENDKPWPKAAQAEADGEQEKGNGTHRSIERITKQLASRQDRGRPKAAARLANQDRRAGQEVDDFKTSWKNRLLIYKNITDIARTKKAQRCQARGATSPTTPRRRPTDQEERWHL